jgi:hypothetical protein
LREKRQRGRLRLSRKLWLALLVALVLPATSAAATAFYYSGGSPLNPGGYWQTADGHQPRSYNRACRSNNSGQASASYYVTYDRIQHTGVVWTNCLQGAFARLDTAYEPAHARCTHEGTVSWVLVCETTRP